MLTTARRNSIQKTARTTGLLYLALLPLSIFGILAVPARVVVPGDAAATASNILASESLYRLSIVSALAVQIVNILVVLALYQLLKPVNRNAAGLMVIFLLVGVPIAMLNELNKFAGLVLLSGAGYLSVFTTAQLQALVTMFLDFHAYGIKIAGILWGLWLLPMGYLVFKSGFLPKILGVLLVIGCFGYLVESLTFFLFPNFEISIAQFTFIGELLLPSWLLIKGVNVERWESRALAA